MKITGFDTRIQRVRDLHSASINYYVNYGLPGRRRRKRCVFPAFAAINRLIHRIMCGGYLRLRCYCPIISAGDAENVYS
jgi:hypothetical protein